MVSSFTVDIIYDEANDEKSFSGEIESVQYNPSLAITNTVK